MTDPTVTVYEVWTFDGGTWRRFVTTHDESEAEALADNLEATGVDVRIHIHRPNANVSAEDALRSRQE